MRSTQQDKDSSFARYKVKSCKSLLPERKKSPSNVHFKDQAFKANDEGDRAKATYDTDKPLLSLYRAIIECQSNVNRLVNQIIEKQEVSDYFFKFWLQLDFSF